MWKTLIEKECKAVLLSPRFAAIFAIVAVLLLLSIGIGVLEYRAFERTQAAAAQLLSQEQAEASSWLGFGHRVFRRADPLQVFAAGVHNDVGRLSPVGQLSDVRLRRSVYADDPIFAVFRFLDLTFLVQVVLSLFAILLTYDTISGEREQGTLQLTFAAAVPRARYLLAKMLGTWLGLTVPLAVPLLAGLLLVVVAGIPMSGDDWLRLSALLAGATLYFTFFITLGVAVSALTRRPSTSFLALLVLWIGIVLVIPRAGVLAAADLVPVPSAAELSSRKSGYERRQWDDYRQTTMDRWSSRQASIRAQPEDQRDAYEDEHTWDWMEQDEADREAVKARIAHNTERVSEDARHRKAGQERLGLRLSRLSPAASFQLVALTAAGTGLDLGERYQSAIDEYNQRFSSYLESRGAERMVFSRRRGGHDGGDDDSGGGNDPFGQTEPLDLRDMPRFEAPVRPAAAAVAATLPDLSLLAVAALLAFAVAFTAFLRYDVRPG